MRPFLLTAAAATPAGPAWGHASVFWPAMPAIAVALGVWGCGSSPTEPALARTGTLRVVAERSCPRPAETRLGVGSMAPQPVAIPGTTDLVVPAGVHRDLTLVRDGLTERFSLGVGIEVREGEVTLAPGLPLCGSPATP